MSPDGDIASWDWKAQKYDIANELNKTLKTYGSDLRFVPLRDSDGDNIELLLVREKGRAE